MNQDNFNIEHVLHSWGSRSHQLPLNNEMLKLELLNKLPYGTPVKPKFSWGLPWLPLGLTSLAIIILLMNSVTILHTSNEQQLATLQHKGINMSALSSGESIINRYWPETDTSIPATDTREFLKTDYSASIKSRRIDELTNRLQIIIRGFGGRIDSSSSNQQSGFIHFAVPADKFEAFRNELKAIAGERFVTENIQTTNLLPQKRTIEEQQAEATSQLNKIQNEREQLITSHNKTVASLQSQLASIARQQKNLQDELISNPDRQQEIIIRQQALERQRRSLTNRLTTTNNQHASTLANTDAQITQAQNTLAKLTTQDTQLMNTVQTVTGSISLSWINLVELLNLYIPLTWFSLLLFAGAVIAYLLKRRQSQFRLP